VNGDLAPALIASIGGGGLLAVVVATEARRESAMRRSRVPVSLTFPLEASPDAALRALTALGGLAPTVEVVVEVAAEGEEITHRLHVPESLVGAVGAQVGTAIPGLRLRPDPDSVSHLHPALVLGVGLRHRATLNTTDPEGAGRALLAALLPLREGESVVVRWALRPGHPATGSELTAAPSTTERQLERAWQTKLASPGLFASGLVLVQAANGRSAQALASRVMAVLRTRRLAHEGLTIRRRWSGWSSTFPRTGRRSGWLSVGELLPLLGWPLGSDVMPGVQVGAARQIAPRESLARTGRPLFVSERHGKPRPVAIGSEAARRHVAVLGASGGGKSTMLAAGILAEIRAGYGGVLIDPKNDLAATVLDHVDAADAGRIVVLDPSADVVPGVDLFGGGDPDLRSDVLLAIFRKLFNDSWGPRIDSYLRLGLRSLAELPGAGLLDLPRLYLDPIARRQVVSRLRDPLLIGQWQSFEALSEAEKAQHLQAPLSRVLALVGRPPVQAVFGPNPKLDVAQLLRDRGWLLVSLSGGTIGAPAARIIGSALTYLIWSAITARAAIPPERRRPVFLYFDELQALTDQGLGMEDFLEQARGLGAGVTVATQAIARTPASIRTSLLSNVGTLISFRAGAEEAQRLSRELPGLSALDLQSLAPYEVAARVATGQGSGSVVVTGRTEPLPDPTGQADHIRVLSGQRFGRSREEIKRAVAERYGMTSQPVDEGELGRQRRQP